MHSITWPISKGLYDTGGAKRHSWDPQDDLDNGYNGYVRIHSQTLNTFDLCDPLLNIFQSQWFYAVDDSEARVTGWWQKGHCANGRASNFQFQWRLQIPGPETWTLSEAGQDRRNDQQEFRKTYFDMAIIYIKGLRPLPPTPGREWVWNPSCSEHLPQWWRPKLSQSRT